MRHVLLSVTLAALALLVAEQAFAASAEVAVDKAEVLEQKVAAGKEGEAAPAAQPVLTKSEVVAVDPAGQAPVDDAITCLSRTIYWEAKGGTDADMEAVASVVINRLGHEGFPDTICGVVKQGVEQKTCQFSWWCDGRADQVKEDDRYALSREVARKALNQQLQDRTHGAMYFHDRKVHPAWASKYVRTAQTEGFLFYKPRQGKAR